MDHQSDAEKYGRLTYVKPSKAPRKAFYLCDCGVVKEFYKTNVRSGKSNSCGCLAKEVTAARSTIHGQSKRGQHTRAYEAWANMIARCTKEYRHDYARYGGRGITVCARWVVFENFFSDMGEPDAGLSLERKKNEEGYSPGNCRWATSKEQANNRRSNVFIEHNGKRQNIGVWADELGIKRGTIEARIKRGKTLSSEILAPP